MEQLLYSAGMAVLGLVRFADLKATSGTMRKRRLIIPSKDRLRKWVDHMLKDEDSKIDHQVPNGMESGTAEVYVGDLHKMDPEHLPAVDAWERFGNTIRIIPRFLGSPESAFGFRVACATLSVGIVAFLQDTQEFFIEQKLVWAMIYVALGMSPRTGSSMFGFFGRLMGTFLAMIFCIVNWYVVVGQTA
jgi:hypothetical protein